MRVDDGMSSAELGALDLLELELRKIPEVLAVGFEGPAEGSSISTDAVITVHVFVAEGTSHATMEQQALDLGRMYIDRPLRIVVAPEAQAGHSGAAASEVVVASHRVQLVEVALTADGATVQVTLAFGDARTTGVGSATALTGAVDATLAALRELGWLLPFSASSGVRLTLAGTGAVLVHLTGSSGARFGVSGGVPAQQAAAEATLHALNRWLDDPARRPAGLRHTPAPR
jgi:hypothetical protein